MKRGRKPGSIIRKNICDLLFVTGPEYGYALFKKYIICFPKISMRSIYYHLNKGTELGIFTVKKIEITTNTNSWGNNTERKIC